MTDNIRERHEKFRGSKPEVKRPFSAKRVIIYAIIIALIVLVGAIFVYL